MAGFEQGFADTERAAAATVKSAGEVTKAARALERAAKTGSINAMRKAQAELDTAIGALNQEATNAGACWRFRPDDEENYMKENFAEELRAEAQRLGLRIHQRDEQLIASPSIVRVLPTARAVRIDRKQASTIRPSYLVSKLLEKQKGPSRANGRAILEAMYKSYQMLVGGLSPSHRLEAGQRQAVPLSSIYAALTLMPGTGREYSQTDFARDLYRLDTNGPVVTRRGSRIHFYGGRQSSISYVDRDGNIISYYNVAFTEAGNG